MPHMPTLGSAYEAITKSAVDNTFVLPPNLGLSVVSGFVRVGEVMLDNQIDCMLIYGKGERYGLTDEYIVDIVKTSPGSGIPTICTRHPLMSISAPLVNGISGPAPFT